MTRIAILHPEGLLAKELQDQLDLRRDLWQTLELFSDREEEIGALTEIRGGAAMVRDIVNANLGEFDVFFLAGNAEASRAMLPRLPAGATVILLATDTVLEDGVPVVAAVNLEAARRDRPLLNPDPGTIALAHLLHPVMEFQPRRVVATLIQPISTSSSQGLDEVFHQTKAILTFAEQQPREIFPVQMAFNLIPSEGREAEISRQLALVLGLEAPTSLQVLSAGIFHSYSISLHLELEKDPGLETLVEQLHLHSLIDPAVDPELLGPIDAAARDEVLLGPVSAVAGQPGTYRIWAVMDNLTCGGALNAIHILEAVGGGMTH